uniref:non-specific serine/threonine protein kinase n=1 Tax=Solibacter usitatus (strain Ellin6076) TaxID=234267 RepID=Q01YI9_SOLUE
MDKIGPFQLLETIHLGSQPLFRARGKDGQEVAVKAIPVANLTDETRERFTREAETCRKLDHPNIIRVFETGEADGMLYQAMELLAGADLGKVMSEGRHFDWEAKLSIMEQVSSGLQYAHEHQLVHRDIKPANLFLENSGRVKVLDFGMVRVAESELTKAGSSLGTLNYMSPEQIRGERVTPATDVFSAGIVFYQLASGRHPFSSRDRGLAQVVSAIVFEAPPKLSEVCPDAPEGLGFILDRALEKDVARRLQNAGDLKHAVSLCRMALGMAPPPAPPPAKEDLGATKVMRTPPQAGAPAPEDEGRTLVHRRPVPTAPPPASGELAEAGKTRALPRMSPPKPVAPPPPPPPAAPKPLAAPPRPAAPAAQYSYCPSCTFANPAGSAVCQRCQTPFAAPPAAAVVAKSSQMSLYVAIGVAVLLAIVLIVVLMMK